MFKSIDVSICYCLLSFIIVCSCQRDLPSTKNKTMVISRAVADFTYVINMCEKHQNHNRKRAHTPTTHTNKHNSTNKRTYSHKRALIDAYYNRGIAHQHLKNVDQVYKYTHTNTHVSFFLRHRRHKHTHIIMISLTHTHISDHFERI